MAALEQPSIAQSAPHATTQSADDGDVRLNDHHETMPESVNDHPESMMSYAQNVASIDFGTANISLAYRIGNTRAGPAHVRNLEIDRHRTRVPTSILLQKLPQTTPHSLPVKVLNIGLSAQQRYVENRGADMFFDCPKLMLRGDQPINRQMRDVFQGKQYYVMEIISIFFQHLKMLLQNQLNKRMKMDVKVADFTWVITIPAIWSHRAGAFMREAAYMAGLFSDEEKEQQLSLTESLSEITLPPANCRDKIIIALEPECAALYCQQVDFNDRKNVAEFCSPKREAASRCYMIIDIGGGTVDIAIHDLVSHEHVNSYSTGKEWGGSQINKAFSEVLQEIVCDPGFLRFYTKRKEIGKACVYEIVNLKFEECKYNIGNYTELDVPPEEFYVGLNHEFIKFYERKKIINFLKKGSHRGISTKDGARLIITYDRMKEIFESGMSGIQEGIGHALRALSKRGISQTKIEVVYLVGGLGGCGLMYTQITNHILKKFGMNVILSTDDEVKKGMTSVIVPLDHELAVSRGAVIYQSNPGVIKSRVCQYNYGILIEVDFNPAIHCSPNRAFFRGEEKKVIVFYPLVKKGDILSMNDAKTCKFPASTAMNVTTIKMYSIEGDIADGAVIYATNVDGSLAKGVTEVVTSFLDTPLADRPDDRMIEIEFGFDRVMIEVKACYKETRHTIKTIEKFYD